jgi:hypothetical protein
MKNYKIAVGLGIVFTCTFYYNVLLSLATHNVCDGSTVLIRRITDTWFANGKEGSVVKVVNFEPLYIGVQGGQEVHTHIPEQTNMQKIRYFKNYIYMNSPPQDIFICKKYQTLKAAPPNLVFTPQ